MKIVVIGLNHKTAPLDVREKLTFGSEQVRTALLSFKQQYPDIQAVLLSTCNRTELYCAVSNGRNRLKQDELTGFFAEISGERRSEFEKYLYVYRNEKAVKHLLTVAGSLDSLVIGEPQILAQVKESYRLAVAAGGTGKIIHRLFHCAFATSKEIYSLTSIAQRRVSVAGVAVKLAEKLFADISDANVLVIGAGTTGELLIRHLLDVGCNNITVVNRTVSRADCLTEKYDIKAGKWSDLQHYLHSAGIVIAAVTAEEHLFDKSILAGRKKGNLLIIDIAVPRNFAPDVDELEDVFLYSIDDLAKVAQENIQARKEDIGQAHEIIADNVDSFMDWLSICDIGPLIGVMRKKFQQISKTELDRFLADEKDMTTTQRQKTEAAVNRIVNKLVHQFINNLHTTAKTQGPDEAAHIIESIINYRDSKDKQ